MHFGCSSSLIAMFWTAVALYLGEENDLLGTVCPAEKRPGQMLDRPGRNKQAAAQHRYRSGWPWCEF